MLEKICSYVEKEGVRKTGIFNTTTLLKWKMESFTCRYIWHRL